MKDGDWPLSVRRGGMGGDLQAALLGREDQMGSWGVAGATEHKARGPLIGWQGGNIHS